MAEVATTAVSSIVGLVELAAGGRDAKAIAVVINSARYSALLAMFVSTYASGSLAENE
jgi:hypothetical protein